MARYALPILSPIPSLCNSQSYQVVLSSDPCILLGLAHEAGEALDNRLAVLVGGVLGKTWRCQRRVMCVRAQGRIRTHSRVLSRGRWPCRCRTGWSWPSRSVDFPWSVRGGPGWAPVQRTALSCDLAEPPAAFALRSRFCAALAP